MFFKLLITICAATLSVQADVGPNRNAYLPPSKGYVYTTPKIPFVTPTRPRPTPSTPTSYTPTHTPSYTPSYTPTYTPTRPYVTPTPSTYKPTRPGPPYEPQPSDHDHTHEHHHEPGMPFDFSYSVNDVEHGNDYSHNAVSDGDVTRGEYRIQLPDGRVQVVKYTADWKNGFNAQVRFEGQPGYNPYKGAGSSPPGAGYKY